jgi:D-alanine-D-alanine ligase
MKRINVVVIFGGTNTEHEVSIVSARSVLSHLNPDKYLLYPILITKDNLWINQNTKMTIHIESFLTANSIDVVFPVLHGPMGEDGTIQGLLEMMNFPYVGCGVLASAICMDKAVQKQLCQSQSLPVVPYVVITKDNKPTISHLKYPLFVKPACQGSSVGVSKVKTRNEFISAVEQAFKYDTKVIVEQGIDNPREIECAVLGTTEKPESSVLGEIISSNEFYDYDAKYIDGQSQAIIPSKLSAKLAESIQDAAKKAFSVCNCYGLARVDFLLDRGGEYYLSELNTLPGFTSISMYPKLWSATGINYEKLLEKLIDLALTRHQEKSKLQFSFTPKTNWQDS